MSWKPEVTTGSDPKWYGNALRFPTKEEAEAQVFDLSCRWFAVRETRVVEVDEPANYRWNAELGKIVEIKKEAE